MVKTMRILGILALVLALVAVTGVPALANPPEKLDGSFTVVDENGREVFSTGLGLTVGDEFVNEDNQLYRVESIQGDRAVAKLVGNFDLALTPEEEALIAISPVEEEPWYAQVWSRVKNLWYNPSDEEVFQLRPQPLKITPAGNKIGLYHTHSDESYQPTDGVANTNGRGGIYKVGTAFKSALSKKGFTATQSLANHNPHDNDAYVRSRRTAMELLTKLRPMALFDIHRDTTPKRAYERVVAGQMVTQVMLVVGKENPSMSGNLAWAKRLKSQVDKTHPGLIRGIFFANGDYNQDLYPRNLLIEVGSHENARELAEKGISLLADAVPGALGSAAPGPAGPARGPGAARESGSGLRTLGILLLVAIIGGGIFLVVSSGGFKLAAQRLRNLGSELASFLGSRRRREVIEPERYGQGDGSLLHGKKGEKKDDDHGDSKGGRGRR